MVSRTPSNSRSSGTRSGTNTRDVIRIFFRHKRKMLVFFCTMMALVVLGLIVYPRSYRSDARLFVRIGKESVGLDPTATVNETVSVNDSRETEINSAVEILRSRVLLEDVVARLGAAEVLRTSQSGGKSWRSILSVPVDAFRTYLNGKISSEECAVNRLEKCISVTAGRKSNVIALSCRSDDPAHAQRILGAYLECYLDRHVKANRTPGSYEFFVDQSKLLSEQLQKVNEELRDAKNKITLVSIEGQQQNVQTQASSIEAAMLENERALAHSEAKVAFLKKSLEELPQELLAEQTAGYPNVAADAMRNELYKLQIQEKEASSRFTSLHPTVIALRRQVADTRKILDEQEGSRSQTTRRLSPVHQSVQTELVSVQALSAAQRAEAQSLKDQYDTVRSRIQTLNDNEFRITELTRKAELIEASYRSYISNREQARIDQALALGRISNVNIVQPPSFIAKPSSPRNLLTLLAGTVLATLGTVLLAFVAEYLDQSFKTSDQIEQELGLPVLFTVPRGVRHELVHN
jgi:uncharacterized protein involved in exopolysaccharide biosynthesis